MSEAECVKEEPVWEAGTSYAGEQLLSSELEIKWDPELDDPGLDDPGYGADAFQVSLGIEQPNITNDGPGPMQNDADNTPEVPNSTGDVTSCADHKLSENKCAICDSYLHSNTIVVKTRALKRLITSSQQRGDGKEAIFRKYQQLTVHTRCRNVYINDRCISADLRKSLLAKERKMTFDFKKYCVICAEVADEVFIKSQFGLPAECRVIVARVNSNTQSAILSGAIERAAAMKNDEWSQQVIHRIDKVDLEKENAVYHADCLARFVNVHRARGSEGPVPVALHRADTVDDLKEILARLGNRTNFEEAETLPVHTPTGSENPLGKCIICDLTLCFRVVVVKEEELPRLIEASRKRGDGKEELFKSSQDLKLHEKCKFMYTDELAIHTFRLHMEYQQNGIDMFDFEKCCLLCGKVADEEFVRKQAKLPSNKRVLVIRVTKPSTQNSLVQAGLTHDDDWSRQVLQRILNVNLQEKNAVYHKPCYSKFVSNPRPRGMKRGRQVLPETAEAMEHIYNFLESYNDDCQISIADIRTALPHIELPSDRAISYNLQRRYGNSIISPRTPPVISLITKCRIEDSWYEIRDRNEELEKRRIIDMAANIIVEDMQSRIYESENYPSPVGFLDGSKEDCPKTLLRLLRTIIVGNKADPEPYERKCVALSHAVVSAARPKSFRSPVLLGLSSMIHRQCSNRHLLDILSGIGFCATYDETLRFQASALTSCDTAAPKYGPQFTQFIFDSAGEDNGNTMVGIQCTNPASNTSTEKIRRLNRIPSSFPKRVDQITTLTYSEPPMSGLTDVVFTPPTENEDLLLAPSDLLCMYGKSKQIPNMPGHNYLICLVDKENIRRKHITEIKPVPFINGSGSSYDRILTALDFATKQCELSNIDCCVVTFGQPLYQQAQEIVKSAKDPHISKIILRLGGCGILKSFMGAIGKIMNGSGLEELWGSVYTTGSIDKMMTGQQYERSVRGHWLTSVALFDIISKQVAFDTKEKYELERSLFVLMDGKIIDIDNDIAESAIKKIATFLEELEHRGPTASLWASYFRMTMIIQHFIKAERTGDWYLHISCIRKMLPYLHAAGHFEYAKSAALYLQDMDRLETTMTPESFQKFVTEGLFAVMTTKERSSGSFGDLIIERSLMRPLKTRGGTPRRDDLENRVQGLPILNYIDEAIENFSACTDAVFRHKDGTKARIKIDDRDLDTFSKWFGEHNPFPHTPDIICISTGSTGGVGINPQDALKIGRDIMDNRKGASFAEITYSRNETIQSLAALNSAIAFHKINIPIDPDLILKRVSRLRKTPSELKSYLQYELAPYPLSLFDKNGLRRTNKTEFYQMFEADVDGYDGDGKAHIIDGEFLLHDVLWDNNKVENIIAMYVEYVKRIANPTVVFEGYVSKMCVKTQEKLRMKSNLDSVEIEENTEITMDVKKFLSNVKNKGRFIELLIQYLKAEGIQALQCSGVADTLIVSVAVAMADTKRYKSVTIISDNVDVLAILTSKNAADVTMLRPGKRGTQSRLYKAGSFNGDPDTVLIAHAFTGSATTSAIYMRGKTLACSKILDDPDLKRRLSVFKDPLAETGDIVIAGEEFFRHLYSETTDFKQLRYEEFARLFTKNRRDLFALPPTASAAKQHSLRVYYQVQKWLDNELSPTEWGWENQATGLYPVTTLDDLVPRKILEEISCKCKISCTDCSCIVAGLECSVLCLHCLDRSCCREIVIEEGDVDEEIELHIDRWETDEFDENVKLNITRSKSGKRRKVK